MSHLSFSSHKDASPHPAPWEVVVRVGGGGGRREHPGYFFSFFFFPTLHPGWRESGGAAALVLVGCIGELEEVEEEESSSEMPLGRERG